MSVSFPAALGDAIRESAEQSGQSLSAWLGAAAQVKLRSEALRVALEEYQAEHGAFTAEELSQAERELGFSGERSTAA